MSLAWRRPSFLFSETRWLSCSELFLFSRKEQRSFEMRCLLSGKWDASYLSRCWIRADVTRFVLCMCVHFNQKPLLDKVIGSSSAPKLSWGLSSTFYCKLAARSCHVQHKQALAGPTHFLSYDTRTFCSLTTHFLFSRSIRKVPVHDPRLPPLLTSMFAQEQKEKKKKFNNYCTQEN